MSEAAQYTSPGFDAVEILHRPFQRDHVAAVVAHHAFREAGRAGRVEDVERVGREHRHAGPRGLARDQRVVARRRPVVVAAFDQRGLGLRPLQDQAGLGLVRRQRRSPHRAAACRGRRARLDAAACREDQLRLAVVDAGREFLRGEAAEHHRMDRADARAGKHREQRFRHHRHVEDDAVALGDAEVAQDGGERLSLGQQPA